MEKARDILQIFDKPTKTINMIVQDTVAVGDTQLELIFGSGSEVYFRFLRSQFVYAISLEAFMGSAQPNANIETARVSFIPLSKAGDFIAGYSGEVENNSGDIDSASFALANESNVVTNNNQIFYNRYCNGFGLLRIQVRFKEPISTAGTISINLCAITDQ